ncbi:glycosyltransferase family 2 protein [Tabrizicola aquatica]|uniref:glycosyltransferase family 2 protein n=1 Tax=Tabrizicola aquatica TaxID=909926 RepID=UPI000CD2F8B7|nr:glycosyltransferase family 2 protein [Tabrizicola aquatica]
MPAAPAPARPGVQRPEQPLISIILPCLDEEAVLAETLARLGRLAAGQPDCRFEFVFVDDGSRDRTPEILREAAARDPRVRVLRFARNFGQQIAVSAGIEVAKGDAVVLMDADLQDPPEVVAQMIDRWRQGFDVVYGTRASRRADSLMKRATARLFYSTINRLSEVPIPADTGDFRLMGRPVVDVLRQMPERHRFIRGMVSWVGFRQTSIPYDRPERFAGVTKYPLRKMLRFAADGILSFSIKPLQLSIALGLIAATLALFGIAYALFMRIFTSVWVEGWTALMIAVLFMGGVQLICLGIMGEYIGRIYSEVKRRPLYVVAERMGFDETGE